MLKITFTQPEPSLPEFSKARQDSFLEENFLQHISPTLHRCETEPLKYVIYHTALPFNEWKLEKEEKEFYVTVYNPFELTLESLFRKMHVTGEFITARKSNNEEYDTLKADKRVLQIKPTVDDEPSRQQNNVAKCVYFAGRKGLSMQIEVFERINADDFDKTDLSIDTHKMQMTLSKN
jgi:hypothetical protein